MQPLKKETKLQMRHFVIALLVGLISGLILQNSQFPLQPEAVFSFSNFLTYTLASTFGVLLFMRLNLHRE